MPSSHVFGLDLLRRHEDGSRGSRGSIDFKVMTFTTASCERFRIDETRVGAMGERRLDGGVGGAEDQIGALGEGGG